MALDGKIERGIVLNYDPASMTATVASYNGASMHKNVVCPFNRYD